MKIKKYLNALLAIFFLKTVAVAQSPQSIPYQAVARDASGNLISNQSIGLQFTMHNGSSGGAVVYQETQTTTTNKLGLFNVNVGTGTVVSGTFSTINWGSGSKFLQVEMDPSGGVTYTNMGTTQMRSVPYALYASSGGTPEDATNEGNLTVGAGTSLTSLIHSNTSGSTDVTLQAGTNVSLSESGNTITINSSNPGGTVTSIATTAPITGGTISSTGTIGITQSGTSSNGYLSSTDWNNFNSKVGGTGTSTRVAFWGGTSTLSSSSNLYWDNSNSRLGIGNASPGYNLDVTGDINFSSGNNLKYGGVNVIYNNASDVYANIRVISNQSTTLQDGMYINYNSTGSANADLRFYANGTNERMRIQASTGNVGIGVAPLGTSGNARLSISRDNTNACCGGEDATLALAENSASTGRKSSISFHNSGQDEGELELTGTATGLGTTARRIRMFDHQSSLLGLQLTGNLFYGNNDSRTQTRDNASLPGNAGAQSGFYETSAPSPAANWPTNEIGGSSSWQHLLDIRHSNPGNNYAMQIAGSFFDQDVFVRKTNDNASQPWARVVTSRDIVSVKTNTASAAFTTRGSWVTTLGPTGWMDVRNGDNIKFDALQYFKLTGGSADEFVYMRVYVEGQNGCPANPGVSQQSDYFHPTEASADHDNFKPVPYLDVWTSNCTGQQRYYLQTFVSGDDNWQTGYKIVVATRY